MRLRDKQRLVERFKAGESLVDIWFSDKSRRRHYQDSIGDFEIVLRQYLNGKFKLAAKRKRRAEVR